MAWTELLLLFCRFLTSDLSYDKIYIEGELLIMKNAYKVTNIEESQLG